MDVDTPLVQQKEDLLAFFALRADEFAWQTNVVHEIRARRSSMSGTLFFDILLQLGGVDDAPSLYPPADVAALQRLLDVVESAAYDSMKRDCLVYYLLRWQMDGREVSYADEKVISPHYVALADAYWHLDAGINLGNAISLLSDARIVKDYTTKIMETLALSADSSPLIRKFVRTCKPALRDTEDLERYLVATAEYSVVEAWQYQRTFPEIFEGRKNLIHKLLTWALTPKPRQQALTQLLSVPYSKFEENIVQGFAINPPNTLSSSSTAIVRDMVCVRLIQSCKYVEAVKFDRRFPSPGGAAKGTWGAERGRIISEVLSIMPPVERTLLESELDGLEASSSQGSKLNGSGSAASWSSLSTNAATDLSMSWEEIGRRSSGAPRKSMGGHVPAAGRQIPSKGPRPSLPNGLAAKQNLFIPGASTSTPRAQPLSAHPTLISEVGTIPTSSGTPSMSFTTSAFNTSMSQSTPSRVPPQRQPTVPAPPKIVVNGMGTPKTNAFMTRNAFFEPPEPGSPKVTEVNGFAHKTSESPQRPQRQPITRLPTPPQDEPNDEPTQSTLPLTETQPQDDYGDRADTSQSVDGDDHSATSERDDLSFSIFSSSTTFARRDPPVDSSSPKRTRKTRATSEKRVVPGAFVSDDEGGHEFLSPKSATLRPTQTQESISETGRRAPAAGKRSSRKRAASPDESTSSIKVSIPGTLYETDEDVSHDHDQENEEADELAPLPSEKGGRRKTSTRTKTRTARSSRASSAEPEEISSGRPVRRSSRLSTAPSSPVEKKSTRPRKSTRTSGPGATATGKGASKRK